MKQLSDYQPDTKFMFMLLCAIGVDWTMGLQTEGLQNNLFKEMRQ